MCEPLGTRLQHSRAPSAVKERGPYPLPANPAQPRGIGLLGLQVKQRCPEAMCSLTPSALLGNGPAASWASAGILEGNGVQGPSAMAPLPCRCRRVMPGPMLAALQTPWRRPVDPELQPAHMLCHCKPLTGLQPSCLHLSGTRVCGSINWWCIPRLARHAHHHVSLLVCSWWLCEQYRESYISVDSQLLCRVKLLPSRLLWYITACATGADVS